MTSRISERAPLPPISLLREFYHYAPETGDLFHKKKRSGIAPGQVVGSEMPDGYRRVKCQGRLYLTHRVIYAIIHGVDPGPHEVDHADGDKRNNRLENLRLSTKSQNLANGKVYKSSKTGFRGVYYFPVNQKFGSAIQFNKKRKFLGYFDTPELAALAYDKAAKNLFGEFSRPNFQGDVRA